LTQGRWSSRARGAIGLWTPCGIASDKQKLKNFSLFAVTWL